MKKGRAGKDIPCAECGKVFYISPGRLQKNKVHTCSRACAGSYASKYRNQRVQLTCPICDTQFELKKSHVKNRVTHTCSISCSAKWRSLTEKGTANHNSRHKNELERVMADKASACNRRGRIKGIEAELTRDDLLSVYSKQKGRCYYSNLPFQLGDRHYTISADRINNDIGYIKDNVVLCLNVFNRMKADMPLQTFYSLIENFVVSRRVQQVQFKCLHKYAQPPSQKNKTDVGYDLHVCEVEDKGDMVILDFGIAVQAGSLVYPQLCARSSLYKYGLLLSNGVGQIDPQYTGSIKAVCYKMPNYKQPKVGDRLCQLVFTPTTYVQFEEVNDLDDTVRGEGGFGSSGK
jgi:dUTP pyrophosphatase